MGKKSRNKGKKKETQNSVENTSPKKTVKNTGGGNKKRGWKGLSPVTRFVLTTALLIGAFYTIFWTTEWFHKYVVASITALDAKIASIFLNIFGWGTITEGQQISSDAMTLNVKTGCDGLEAMAIFGSGVIAYTASIADKFKGVLFGVGSLFVLNIVRIVHLYLCGVYMPRYFEFFHQNFWQILFILFALILLAIWIGSLNKKTTN